MAEQATPARAALAYNGATIRERGEMLCLTDMWRAASSQAAARMRSADWARKEGSQFIDFIAETLNMPVRHIFETERGRDGGTWAHWQIGMAYARYLSPEFHAWCNAAVRAHMEGLRAPAAGPPVEFALCGLPRRGRGSARGPAPSQERNRTKPKV